MRIIIIGAGVIGTNLAKSLSEEDHEVYLIERDEIIARKIDEKIDVKVVIGDGSDPDTLERVAVDKADLVVAVTLSDETNLVVCSLATAYGAKQCIARVRNPKKSQRIPSYGHWKLRGPAKSLILLKGRFF